LRYLLTIIYLVCISVSINAQQRIFKFDFGTSNPKKGHIGITSKSIYTSNIGYGFTLFENLVDVQRKSNKKDANFISSKNPFQFSVKLPEGNYDVMLVLGDTEGASATTVRTECRRLMLENIKTNFGELKPEVFTVHIRDSLIRDKINGTITKKVKLKQREYNYLHWDNLLTIEFNDSLPKVCSIKIEPNTTATTIFLAGNSTVVDQSNEPWAAWGQMFPV
jgi:hypothetical protein